MKTTWSVNIEELRTQLRVGTDADALVPQFVRVALRMRGISAACPTALSECIDYAPLFQWITEEWPRSPHVALLEERVNELLTYAFELDWRVQEVQVEVAKQRLGIGCQATWVGIERHLLRPEFEAQQRHLKTAAATGAERNNL